MSERANPGYKIFIFWERNKWGYFYGRKEALAREFAKVPDIKEVVCVERAMTPLDLARKLLQALFEKNAGVRRAAWFHIKKCLSPRPVRLSHNLLVFNPAVPFPLRVENALPLARRCNLWLLSLQMRAVWKRFGGRKDGADLVLFSPPQKYTEYLVSKCLELGAQVFADLEDDVLDRARRRKVSGPLLDMYRGSYAFVLSKCRMSFAVGADLAKDYAATFNAKIIHVPNGVKLNGETSPWDIDTHKDRDKRKSLLYVGNVNDKLNNIIAEQILSRYPDVKLKLLGTISPEVAKTWKTMARKHPNLSLAGPVQHREVQKHLNGADVFVQIKNPELCKGCDSLKLYEYLATGKPIVTTTVPPAETFARLVYIADGPESFSQELGRALRESDPSLAAARREAVKEHSWEQRAKVILQYMTDNEKLQEDRAF
ncbi:MAG: glycosyltransferase family 4 protein [bacterium]